MNFKTIVFLLALVVGVGLAACSPEQKAEPGAGTAPSAPNPTNTLPSFALLDAAGNTVNLSSFKGKKVFVNLWATWCPPCRAEIPSIEQLYAQANREKAVFVMLSLDEGAEAAKQYAAKERMTLPIYYPAEKLPALFNTGTIPTTFIFDEQGALIKQHTGMDDYSKEEYVSLFQ